MDTINEILKDINADPSAIKKHANNRYLREFLETALLPEKKLNFPEGPPPYTATNAHPQQTKSAFWEMVKKMNVLRRTDVPKLRLETIFIQNLEAMSEEDANIVIFMKDQALHEIFPNITYDTLASAGYFEAKKV